MQPVSVYIPSYNVETFIGNCIEHLLKQTCPPDEILVINDGSKDKTVEIAQKYPVKIIHHQGNQGLSAARNTGMQNARNELVASIDADCMATPTWLEELVKAVDSPKIGGVGGKLIEHFTELDTDRWRAVHMRQHWWDEKQVNPQFLFGHSNIFRKKAVEEAGWYNPKFRTNYEDVDMSNRVRAKGYDLVYVPTAVVQHYRRDTTFSVLNAYWRWTMFDAEESLSTKQLLKKWRFNLGKSWSFIISDIKAKQSDLVFLNLLMFPYHSYFDWKYYKQSRAGKKL